MKEDEILRLDTLLTFDDNDPLDYPGLNGNDADGSESRWVVIGVAGGVVLPVGSTVWADGVIQTPAPDGTYRIDLVYPDNTLPKIEVRPPANFSGNIENVRLTLYAQDSDADSTIPPAAIKSDSVDLTLYVEPQVETVSAPPVSTPEDTPVKFMAALGFTTPDTSSGLGSGGIENIDAIVVKAVPAGWVITYGASTFTGNGDTDFTVPPQTSAVVPIKIIPSRRLHTAVLTRLSPLW